MKEIIIDQESDLELVAKEILETYPKERVFGFFGEMGAGKTTIIKEICRQLGVVGDMTSPTFAIINEYYRKGGEPIYHFDFYRIDKIAEALDIGFFDYIDSGCLCLLEWPENIESILPEETLRVRIEVHPDLSRTVSWED